MGSTYRKGAVLGRGLEAFDLGPTRFAKCYMFAPQLQSFRAPNILHAFVCGITGCPIGRKSVCVSIECDTRLPLRPVSLKRGICCRHFLQNQGIPAVQNEAKGGVLWYVPRLGFGVTRILQDIGIRGCL